MASSSTAGSIETTIQARIATARNTLQMLENAEQAGADIGEAWDGDTPPWLIAGISVGWAETFLIVEAAAVHVYHMQAAELCRDIYIRMKRVTHWLPAALAAQHDANPIISSRAMRALRLAVIIKRSIGIIASHIRNAHTLAQEEAARELSMQDPLVHAAVAGRCVMNMVVREFLDDINMMLHAFIGAGTRLGFEVHP